MQNHLLVATRKGLFVLENRSGSWDFVSHSFPGDPVTMVLPDPRDETLYAALNLGHFGVKLHRSEDGGRRWHEVTTPNYPPVEKDETENSSVKQIWCLETGGEDRKSLWAGTIPGGLFRSHDRGESWSLNDSLWDRPERSEWFGGGYDDPGVHSIAVNPRDSRHLTVAVSCGGVWVSHDEGKTWVCRTKGMFAEYVPPERREDPAIQDPHRLVQCRSAPDTLFVQHHNGVFGSRDGGESWQPFMNVEPSTFGFAAAIHPEDPKIAWTVPLIKDECRLPVDGQVVVARTRDGGASFEGLRNGLPQDHAYDVVYRHGLDVDETGRRLAMGSTTGSLWLSEDQGDSWVTFSTSLPPIYAVRFSK